jgi:hypothetical protein
VATGKALAGVDSGATQEEILGAIPEDVRSAAESTKLLNRLKNDALYVGFHGDEFVEPASRYSEAEADQTASRAARILQHGRNLLGDLRRWAQHPEMTKEFWEEHIEDFHDLMEI